MNRQESKLPIPPVREVQQAVLAQDPGDVTGTAMAVRISDGLMQLLPAGKLPERPGNNMPAGQGLEAAMKYIQDTCLPRWRAWQQQQQQQQQMGLYMSAMQPAQVSGTGYTSGGRLVRAAASGPGKACRFCRHSPCRCQFPVSPSFRNRGMDGFDGLPGPAPETGLGTEEMPDVIGVLRGYRWWTFTAPDLSKNPVRADEDWPFSPLRGMRDIWLDGENIAKCLVTTRLHEDSEIPHSSCACGFWAYWNLRVHDISGSQLPVCGVVEGYGATVIGTRGFRAAKARIVALHMPFTIQPDGDPDPDPLGLGLPPVSRPGQGNGSPASPYNPGGTVYGRGNPWHNHPKFPGRVHHLPGYDPDTGEYVDPSGIRHEPPPPPELGKASAAERQSNRDKAVAWEAVIADRLAQMYPSATVYQTKDAMEADYPPDLTYVPDSGRL